MTPRRWYALEVRLPEDAKDAVLAVLSGWPLTGIEEEAGTLTAYAPAPWDVAALGMELAEAAPDASVRTFTVEEADWLALWKSGWKPTLLGSRLVVAPAWWEEALPTSRAAVRIDPGMAFGTGIHATTALAWELLEPCLDARPARLLDAGTGTGLLALGALTLVPGLLAVGTESDPDALISARANLGLNPAAERLRLVRTADLPFALGAFDLVVANLTAGELEGIRRPLVEALAPRGTLVASGYLAAQAVQAQAGWRALGLAEEARADREGWTALRFGRAQPGAAGDR